jgi:hypothetical protein|tara:strand:+ start:295 stop:1320 length:1026 start_codon:yes stop_codon:yes gene_type:complete
MPTEIKIWEVTTGGSLNPVPNTQISLEEQLETWIEQDISIISSDYMVIGRQVTTDFGGVIDLLCLDSTGDIVVVELKRGKTPREVTAQALDYASWVTDLSHQRITDIANDYLPKNKPLETAFQEAFGEELPETLNEGHSVLIVAESMDSSTERIVKYLSAQGIRINVLTVQHFSSEDGKELVAQTFMIEPSEATDKVHIGSKRRQSLTREKIRSICKGKGLEELHDDLVAQLESVFPSKGTTGGSLAFKGKIGNGGARVILSLLPFESEAKQGLKFQVYTKRLAEYFGITTERVEDLLPASHEAWTYWAAVNAPDIDYWIGFQGFFKTPEEVTTFVKGLSV